MLDRTGLEEYPQNLCVFWRKQKNCFVCNRYYIYKTTQVCLAETVLCKNKDYHSIQKVVLVLFANLRVFSCFQEGPFCCQLYNLAWAKRLQWKIFCKYFHRKPYIQGLKCRYSEGLTFMLIVLLQEHQKIFPKNLHLLPLFCRYSEDVVWFL